MRILCAVGFLPLAAAAGGTDTYNNLFSDLSPIIALFGEQVSKQFLAQSTRFSECILFASAPLGILTGIVSAIRIGGYPWLRAIVGRAAESRAAAGLELTSATSSSICELWDGKSVVRVHGAPNILTVVYLEALELQDSNVSSEDENAHLLRNPSTDDSAGPVLTDFETAKALNWLQSGNSVGSIDRRKVMQIERKRAVEWEQDEETVPQEQATTQPRKPIPPIPPNIALNASRRPSKLSVLVIAGSALLLQASVLIFGGLLNYKILTPEKRAKTFAFPLMTIGTAFVGLGMTLCATVVVLSSRQERWRPVPQGPNMRRPRVIWLQRKQTVNDETFFPYAMTPMEFVGLRGLHWTISVAQLLAMFLATALRISIRTAFAHSMRCVELKNPFELEWLTYQIDNARPLLAGHAAPAENPVDLREEASKAVNLRMQLGAIADSNGWESAFREEAYRLQETIDAFMNMLWSETVALLLADFKDVALLDFEIDLCPTRNCTAQGFSMVIQRSKVPGMFTPWSSNPRQIEAYLALWTYELQREAADIDTNDQEPFNSPRRCVWKSCTMSAQSAMDFDWWVRRGYSYYKTPRLQSRSPLTCSDKLPTAESPFCDDEIIPEPTQLLTVATHCSISCLCARYIFALFLRRALNAIRKLNGETSIRPADSDSAREIVRFHNTAIDDLSRTMASRGLMTPQDSYTLLIPALRHANLLPNALDSVGLGEKNAHFSNWHPVQISFHCHLRAARALKLQMFWEEADKIYGYLEQRLHVIRRINGKPELTFTMHVKAMQDLLRKAKAESNQLVSDPVQAERREVAVRRQRHRAVQEMFYDPMLEKLPPDIIDKCKSSLEWLDTCLEYGYFDGNRQEGLLSILKHAIIQRDYPAVTVILLSQMDEPTTKALRYKLTDLAQYAVNQDTTNILQALVLYALRPLGVGRNFDLANVAAARVGDIESLTLLLKGSSHPDGRDVEGQTALIAAAEAGQRETAKYLLGYNADREAVPPIGGMTALAAAIQSGNCEIVDDLLKAEADANPPHRHYGTPLQLAAAQGSITIMELLVDKGADVNYPASTKGQTALQAAVHNGSEECVRYLLEKGAKVDGPLPPEGHTALQTACLQGHLPLVKLLLEQSADINASGSSLRGHTALQAAALGGHLEVVNLLLTAGANVNSRASHYGLTALQAASKIGNLEIFSLLYEAGASVATSLSRGGMSALQAASRMGHTSVVERLLTLPDVKVNEKPTVEDGFTALQAASKESHLDIAQILLQAGADVNAEAADRHGRTALQAAAESGCLVLVTLLIQEGADVNAAPAEDHGMTAVQGACHKGHLDIVRELYENNADIRASPSIIGGRSALQAAAEGGHVAIVAFLLDHGAFANELPAYMDGVTALQAAESGGFQEITALLTEAGASASFAVVSDPETDLLDDWALQYRPEWSRPPEISVVNDFLGYSSAVAMIALLEQLSPQSLTAWSPLSTAAAQGDELRIQTLLLKPSENPINGPPAVLRGRTALQAASENGHDAAVAQLLREGADPNNPVAEIEGITALEAAAKNGHLAVVRRLLDKGAVVDGGEGGMEERPTALQLAARNGHLAVVEELVDRGADVNMAKRGVGGLTALEGAREEGWEDVVRFLAARGAR
ncbi:MAG: hypothetical protein Q9195_008241 [Heterodermia aff. obscurata]